jgi:hypothetical protein
MTAVVAQCEANVHVRGVDGQSEGAQTLMRNTTRQQVVPWKERALTLPRGLRGWMPCAFTPEPTLSAALGANDGRLPVVGERGVCVLICRWFPRPFVLCFVLRGLTKHLSHSPTLNHVSLLPLELVLAVCQLRARRESDCCRCLLACLLTCLLACLLVLLCLALPYFALPCSALARWSCCSCLVFCPLVGRQGPIHVVLISGDVNPLCCLFGTGGPAFSNRSGDSCLWCEFEGCGYCYLLLLHGTWDELARFHF